MSLLLIGIYQAQWPEQSVGFGSQCLVLRFALLSLWLWPSHWTWLRMCSFMCLLVPNKNFSQCRKYLQYLCLIFAGRRCYIKKGTVLPKQKYFFFFFFLFFSVSWNMKNKSWLNPNCSFSKEMQKRNFYFSSYVFSFLFFLGKKRIFMEVFKQQWKGREMPGL